MLLPFTWAGPYFGVNIGGQWTSDKIRTTSSGPGFFAGEAQSLDAMSPGTVTSAGVIGGMQAGYNWQFDQAVVRLEVDFNGATATGNNSVIGIFNAPPGTALTTTVKQPMFITTVRPRVGWTFDHVMVYATGGYAFATYQVVKSYNFTVGLPGTQGDVTAKLSGWTAGAGVEYAFYKGMSLKLEYLYLGMGSFHEYRGSAADRLANEHRRPSQPQRQHDPTGPEFPFRLVLGEAEEIARRGSNRTLNGFGIRGDHAG